MSDVLIRNVPDGVIVRIEARAKRLKQSRQEYLLGWLIASVEEDLDPQLRVGYIRLDRFADVDAGEMTCVECERVISAGGAYMGVRGDMALFGPLCDFCTEPD